MANEVVIHVRGQDDASKVFEGVAQKAEGLGATLGKVGQIAGGFLAANVIAGAGQKVIGFIGDSIKAASDLGESVNAVNKIFGDSSQQIFDWGKTSANSFGLSQREFNQLVVPLGAGLKNAGLDLDTVAKKSLQLSERAADMASVFNTDVGEALTAIQAGLRGEADPLERFGVGLSAAKVEARALADTGKENAKQLTEQEKALARVNIILEQTESSAGDFRDTSDQLANKQRILNARNEELQATIGQKLLPVQLKITEAKLAMVNAIVTKVIPVLEELYAKHWPAVQKAIDDVVSFVRQYWPEISAVIKFGADFVKTQIEGFIQTISGIVEVISSTVELVKAIFHGDWARAWQEMQDIAEGAVDILMGRIKMAFGNLPEILYNIGRNAGGRVLDGIKDAIGSVGGAVGDAVKSLIPGFASGGTSSGGWAIVGERGPELVKLPPSAHVYSHEQSRGMVAGSGVGAPTIVVNVYGSVLSAERDIARIFRDQLQGGAYDAFFRTAVPA